MRGPPVKLVVLAHLDEPRSLAGLARLTDRPEDSIRTSVIALERQGLVTTDERAGRRIVQQVSPVITAKAGELLDLARPDWSQILHGNRPRILWVLHVTTKAALTAEITGVHLRTVYRIIEDLSAKGVVLRGGGPRRFDLVPWEEDARLPGGTRAGRASRFRLNRRLAPLVDYLREVDRIQAYSWLKAKDPDARLLWHLGPEVLFASTRIHDDLAPGGPSALGRLGIDLMTSNHYHHRAIRVPTEADAILQTLLVDPESKINRSYAALAYEKEKPRDLYEKAQLYQVPEQAAALVHYVTDQQDESGHFLPWSEHDRYRQQYNVGR